MPPTTDLTEISILRRVLELLVTTASRDGSDAFPSQASPDTSERLNVLPDLRVMIQRGIGGPLFVPFELMRTVGEVKLTNRTDY